MTIDITTAHELAHLENARRTYLLYIGERAKDTLTKENAWHYLTTITDTVKQITAVEDVSACRRHIASISAYLLRAPWSTEEDRQEVFRVWGKTLDTQL